MTKPYKYEAGKEYTLRNGWRAKVFMTDGGGEQPIIGACFSPDEARWTPESWHKDGTCLGGRGEHSFDLMPPAPKKRVAWLNVYDDDYGMWTRIYPSREEADASAETGRIACVKIEFTEGEGL